MQQKIRRKTIIKKRISLFSPKKPQLPFTNIHLLKSSSKILYVDLLFFVTPLTLQIHNGIIKKKYVRMIILRVNIKKLDENAIIPKYGSEFAAGADLYACISEKIIINPGETYLVPTGISIEIPEGYAGLIYARSGLASKKGLAPANKVGVVDADYRGQVFVALFNHSKDPQEIENGERIAQLVIAPFLKADFNEVEELSDTVRGEGGFGSTGK